MVPVIVNFTDETNAGKVLSVRQYTFADTLVSVAQIIEKRVSEEVTEYNNQRCQNFHGLVQLSEAEQALNGVRKEQFKPVDAEKQIAIAKKAFSRNGFFLLIDDMQAESLEQTFVLHPQSTVSFVKLTPLVGG